MRRFIMGKPPVMDTTVHENVSFLPEFMWQFLQKNYIIGVGDC